MKEYKQKLVLYGVNAIQDDNDLWGFENKQGFVDGCSCCCFKF